MLQTTDNKTFLLCGRWILSKLPPLCQNQIHRHSKCLFTPTLHPYSWVFLYLGLYLFIYLFIHPSIHSFLGAQSLMCLRLSSISLSSWRWVYTSDPPFPAFQVLRFQRCSTVPDGCGTKDKTHHFMKARQTVCQLNSILTTILKMILQWWELNRVPGRYQNSSLISSCIQASFHFLFSDRDSLSWLGWPQTCVPSASASWIAGTVGIYYQACLGITGCIGSVWFKVVIPEKCSFVHSLT